MMVETILSPWHCNQSRWLSGNAVYFLGSCCPV